MQDLGLAILDEGGLMMGKRAGPQRLFYDFCLEENVPINHLLRRIDGFLESMRVN